MPFQLSSYDPNRNYRCAISARFSSDMQNKASADDQIRECTDAAARYGWTVLDEYIRKDEAVSGQSLVGRDGLLELLEIASQPNCPFDGILIDDTSRFGRNLSETLPLTDKFAGARAAVAGLAASGLFIGQMKEFFTTVQGLADEADAAVRTV